LGHANVVLTKREILGASVGALSLGAFPSSGGNYLGAASAQALAFLARTSGLSPADKSAYAALIDGLVSDGVWSLLDALYIFQAPNLATAKLNLVSSSFALTSTGTTPFFTAYAGFSGSNAGYYSTNFNLTTSIGAGINFTQNSAHISVGVASQTNGTATQRALMGLINGTAFETDIWWYGGGTGGQPYVRVNDASGSAAISGSGTMQGFFTGVRTSSSARVAYKSGSSIASFSNTSGTLPNDTLQFLANPGLTGYSTDQIYAGSIGGALNSTQAAALNNRIATFQAYAYGIIKGQKPTYLFSTFISGSQVLLLYGSPDGVFFYPRTANYTPTSGHFVRDPYLAYFSGQSKLWLAHTAQNSGTVFDLAYSTDGVNFTYVQSVDCSGVGGGGSQSTWSPVWATNYDGTPWLDGSGTPHIYFASNSSGTSASNMQIWEIHPTNNADFSQAWSSPVAITGTSLPTNILPGAPLVTGSTLNLGFSNNGGGQGIGFLTTATSTLTASFTVLIATGTHWSGQGGSFLTVGGVLMSYFSPGGDGYTQVSRSSTNTLSGTWSTIGEIATTDGLQQANGGVIPYPF